MLLGYSVDFVDGEADIRIVQVSDELSELGYDPVVVSVDSDLLVFGDSVKALLYPTY